MQDYLEKVAFYEDEILCDVLKKEASTALMRNIGNPNVRGALENLYMKNKGLSDMGGFANRAFNAMERNSGNRLGVGRGEGASMIRGVKNTLGLNPTTVNTGLSTRTQNTLKMNPSHPKSVFQNNFVNAQ